MARIRLELPEKFSFETEIPIRITDLNYGGHVGNDKILSLVHEARVRFLEHHGYKELNMGGVGLIMSDAALEFKAEAFYGDKIKASVAVGDFSKIGFDIFYKLEKEIDGKKTTVAIAKTGMVCFDYSSKKIAPVPIAVSERLLG